MIKISNIKIVIIISISVLSGCAAKQNVTRFSGNKPQHACIAKHVAVREGVLTALEEGFSKHGIKTKVVDGKYIQVNNLWQPEVQIIEIEGCDAVVFYVANWSWDISTYMRYANIWITDSTLKNQIANATYTAGAGFGKFQNARKKILELVDSMF